MNCISPALLTAETTNRGSAGGKPISNPSSATRVTRGRSLRSSNRTTATCAPSPLSNVVSADAKSSKRTLRAKAPKSSQVPPSKRANQSPAKKASSPRKPPSSSKSTASRSHPKTPAPSFVLAPDAPWSAVAAPCPPTSTSQLYHTDPFKLLPGICGEAFTPPGVGGEAVTMPFAEDISDHTQANWPDFTKSPAAVIPVDLDWEFTNSHHRTELLRRIQRARLGSH